MDKNFGDIFDSMNHNFGKLESLLGELYQHLQEHPEDEMARYMFSKLCVIGEDMVYSQKEFTTHYGDPSIKNNLIGNLDSKVAALHEGQKALESQKL